MRLTKEKKEQNREAILHTASRLFRLHGIENVTVADVMKEAGFTHGGFYHHFKSKEDLAAAAVTCAFDGVANYLSETIRSASDPRQGFQSILTGYVSISSRDAPDGGCPASALPGDASRNGKDIQLAFAEGIEKYLDIFARQMTGDEKQSRQQAITTLTNLVGACVLSRAVKEGQPELSEEILCAVKKLYG